MIMIPGSMTARSRIKKPRRSSLPQGFRLGGLEGIRTLDLLFRRQTLYPLSYEPDSHFPVDNRDHTRTLCAFSHPCASSRVGPAHAVPGVLPQDFRRFVGIVMAWLRVTAPVAPLHPHAVARSRQHSRMIFSRDDSHSSSFTRPSQATFTYLDNSNGLWTANGGRTRPTVPWDAWP